MAPEVRRAVPGDHGELLALMRLYCDFYGTYPSDDSLLELISSLLDNPREGVQLLAREGENAIGFATIYWTWSSTRAKRIGVMNDLYVLREVRGSGVADALVRACREECRANGASRLEWQTAPGNTRAQAFYDRLGATREEWIDYWLTC
jgi:GNAT superfamily N-acetyltransferase